MSSQPGVESLLRLAAARVAAYDERSWDPATGNRVNLLERLPPELHDLLDECRTTLQREEKCSKRHDGTLTPSGARDGGHHWTSHSLPLHSDAAHGGLPAHCMRAAVASYEQGDDLSAGARVQLAAPVRRTHRPVLSLAFLSRALLCR
jgi:hypothetical protein